MRDVLVIGGGVSGLTTAVRLAEADLTVNVRQAAITDCVLFDPEDRAEVELQSTTFIFSRERDLHAIAAARPSGDDRTVNLAQATSRSRCWTVQSVAASPWETYLEAVPDTPRRFGDSSNQQGPERGAEYL